MQLLIYVYNILIYCARGLYPSATISAQELLSNASFDSLLWASTDLPCDARQQVQKELLHTSCAMKDAPNQQRTVAQRWELNLFTRKFNCSYLRLQQNFLMKTILTGPDKLFVNHTLELALSDKYWEITEKSMYSLLTPLGPQPYRIWDAMENTVQTDGVGVPNIHMIG